MTKGTRVDKIYELLISLHKTHLAEVLPLWEVDKKALQEIVDKETRVVTQDESIFNASQDELAGAYHLNAQLLNELESLPNVVNIDLKLFRKDLLQIHSRQKSALEHLKEVA